MDLQRRMRIAFLTTEFVTEDPTSGGLSHYLARVARGCIAFGHTPVIFVQSHVSEKIEYDGITVFRLRPEPGFFVKAVDRLTLRKFSGVLRVFAFAKKCRSVLLDEHRKLSFDMVQAASYNATALCMKGEIPLVVRLSSIEIIWRKAYRKRLTLAQRIFEIQETTALHKADGVYAPSRALAEAARETAGAPVFVVEPPYCVEQIEEDRAAADQLKDREYLLFYGSIGRLKGCEVIAGILPELFTKYPGMHFVFCGRVERYSNHSMMDHVFERAGMFKKNIVYFNGLPHSQLYPVIRSARAVVLPSLVDNLPNTCLESMGAGAIVIGTKGASFEQLIEDRVSGFLAMPGDPVSLLACIEHALSLDAQGVAAMAAKAKERIGRMSPDKTIPELIRYYGNIIDNRSRKRP
jgi:glycogen synthase